MENHQLPKFNIHLLDKYMLNESLMNTISRNGYVDTSFLKKQKTVIENLSSISGVYSSEPKTSEKTQIEKDEEVVQSLMFIPEEHDTLFWSFYILKNGIEQYNSLVQRNVVVEKKIKIQYIEKFRQNKTLLKEHKCGPITHIENFLLNERNIDMKTLQALCILENISCVYLFEKCFFEININEDDIGSSKISMIAKQKYPQKYGYVDSCDISHIRNTKHHVDNISKPLKAMTSYKLNELIELCKKLEIPIPEKAKKQTLYNEIVKIICV